MKNLSILTFLSLIILISCGKTDTEDSNQSQLDFSDIKVFNPVQISDVTEFGDDEFFGNVWFMLPLNDELVFVVDGSVQKIYKFSPNGTYHGFIGGEGSGPGEYGQIGFATIIPPDTLAIMDWRRAMITFNSPNETDEWEPKKYLDLPPPPFEYGSDLFFYLSSFSPAENGYLGHYRSSFTIADTASHSYQYFSEKDYSLKSKSDQQLVFENLGPTVVRRTENSVSMWSVMQLPRRLRELTSKNLIVDIWSLDPTIRILNVEGDELRRFPLFSKTIDRTDADKQAVAREVVRDPSNSIISRAELVNMLPVRQNYAHELHIDNLDRIWVKVNPQDEDAPEWIIYSLKGEIIGAMPTIEGRLVSIYNNFIFVNREPVTDIPSFTVYEF